MIGIEEKRHHIAEMMPDRKRIEPAALAKHRFEAAVEQGIVLPAMRPPPSCPVTSTRHPDFA
jgi:hypothetical protein